MPKKVLARELPTMATRQEKAIAAANLQADSCEAVHSLWP